LQLEQLQQKNLLDIEGKQYVFKAEHEDLIVLQEVAPDESGNLVPVENQCLIRDKQEYEAMLVEKQAELQRGQWSTVMVNKLMNKLNVIFTLFLFLCVSGYSQTFTIG